MAIRFPAGTDQYIRAAVSGLTAKPVTVAFWLWQPDLTTTFRVMSIGNTSNAEGLARVAVLDATDEIRMQQISDGETQDRQPLKGTLTATTWMHCAVVITDASDTVYLNGSAGTADTAAFSAGFPTITHVQIAGFVDAVGTALADMRVSHLAIYGSALSGAQITALAGGKNPIDYTPLDLWPLVSDLNNTQAGRNAMVAGSTFPTGTFDYVTGPTIDAPAPPATRRRPVMVL